MLKNWKGYHANQTKRKLTQKKRSKIKNVTLPQTQPENLAMRFRCPLFHSKAILDFVKPDNIATKKKKKNQKSNGSSICKTLQMYQHRILRFAAYRHCVVGDHIMHKYTTSPRRQTPILLIFTLRITSNQSFHILAMSIIQAQNRIRVFVCILHCNGSKGSKNGDTDN